MRGAPARSGSGVVGAAGVVRRVLLDAAGRAKRACARTRAEGRGRGAGERNGGGGGPGSWHERAATVGGVWGACGASGGGIGAGPEGAPWAPPSSRPSDVRGACQKREGWEKWWKAGGWHTGAGGTRGRMGGAMRVARGAGGGSPTQGGRRRHEDLVPVTAAEPSGSYRRPPRGVEPRTLPAIRPTGRPGQRVKSRRNLEKGPPGQPTQAVRMVKAEGLRGLRAKVRGEGGCDHWGHALTRAHARSCLVGDCAGSTGQGSWWLASSDRHRDPPCQLRVRVSGPGPRGETASDSSEVHRYAHRPYGK